MADILKVKNLSLLQALKNHEEGEVAFCEEEEQCMIYKNGEWIPVKAEMKNDGLQLNLYDLNKQIISQLPPLDEEQILEKIKEINKWKSFKWYLLYGKEISYFSILRQGRNKKNFSDFGTTVFELLKDITSKIYSCEKADGGAYEIWIDYQDEPTVLYLFNYEDGIVEYYE